VDGKGRMSIPADFRRVLEAGDPTWSEGHAPKLKVLYGDHLDRALHVYTIDAFNDIAQDIQAMPRGSENRRHLQRLILGQSLTAEVDKDGRCVIPIKQREKIGLTDGEVYFSGAGEYFEIWKADTFAETEGRLTDDWLKGKPQGFDPLVLLDQPKGT
jgi:MraZ protein